MKITKDHLKDRKKGWRCRWLVPGNSKYDTETFYTKRDRDDFASNLELKYSDSACVSLNPRESVLWRRLLEKADELGESVERLLVPVLERVPKEHFSKDLEGVELSVAVEAYKKYGAEKLLWSYKQQKNVRCALNRFLKQVRGNRTGLFAGRARELGEPVRFERAVHMLEREEIVNYLNLEFPGESSWKQNRSIVCAFVRWCDAKGWADKAIVENIKREKILQLKKRKPWWAADKVKLFIEAMEPDLRANWWLRFQAGIRADEVARMRWDEWTDEGFYGVDFSKREIHMNPAWTKMKKYRRIYDLGDAFWEGLLAVRFLSNNKWVTPRGYITKNTGEYSKKYGRRKAQAMLGILSDEEKSLVRTGKMDAPLMPQNLPRHTFAAQGFHHGLEWVIDVLGHEEGLQVFNRNYKGNLDKEEAKDLRDLRI